MCCCYTTQAFLKSVLSSYCMTTDDQPVSGFEATLSACKKLGLDLKGIPRSVLHIFYNSGAAFSDHPCALAKEQRQTWRDSVIWPKTAEPDK